MGKSDTDDMTPPNQLKARHKIEEVCHDHVRTFRRHGTASALAICTVFIAGIASPAGAMETQIAASGSAPVRIDACAAGYGKDSVAVLPGVNISQRDTNLIGAGFDFTNVSGRPISAIRFSFRELDTFQEGPDYAVFVNDWNGEVAPSQSFKGNKAQGYNLTGGDIAEVLCSVRKVRFADGSVWSGGADTAPQGLYYPPTPSPP